MQRKESIKEKAQKLFTQLFLLLSYRTTIDTQETYSAKGRENIVYYFDSPKAVIGQSTPVGTIILNKSCLEGLSIEARDYVFLHELSHNNRNSVWVGVLYGLAGIVAIGTVSLGGFILMIATRDIPANISHILTVSLVVAAVYLLFIAAINVEELMAELSALRVLGEKEYFRVTDEIGSQRSKSLISEIVVKATYPSPETVVKVHRTLH